MYYSKHKAIYLWLICGATLLAVICFAAHQTVLGATALGSNLLWVARLATTPSEVSPFEVSLRFDISHKTYLKLERLKQRTGVPDIAVLFGGMIATYDLLLAADEKGEEVLLRSPNGMEARLNLALPAKQSGQTPQGLSIN